MLGTPASTTPESTLLLTASAAAERCGTSERTWRRWDAAGFVPSSIRISRCIRCHRQIVLINGTLVNYGSDAFGGSQVFKASISDWGETGLLTQSFMPARRQLSRSPCIAPAVMAITGI